MAQTANAARFRLAYAAALVVAGCGDPSLGGQAVSEPSASLAAQDTPPSHRRFASVTSRADSLTDPSCPDPEAPPVDVEGFMTPTRVLRRLSLALTGQFPTREDYEELMALSEPARESWLEAKTDELLAAPAFYDRILEFARHWVSLPPHVQNMMNGAYKQARLSYLRPCRDGTLHEGAYTNLYEPTDVACNGQNIPRANSDDPEGEPVDILDVEPWWAPGTVVRVVGRFANTNTYERNVRGELIDCGVGGRGGSDRHATCGCGPNLIYCTNQSQRQNDAIDDDDAPHRQAWEEPARLFAHIAWHDREATDWIAGSYSVGPRRLQGAYVRHGREGVSGNAAAEAYLDSFEDWWRTDRWTAPTDPNHASTDPLAWSEFEIESRHPLLVTERTVRFDPRTQPPASLTGVPSAGMLTSLGVTGNWPRARVRGARLLEILACEDFTPPPSDQTFNEYERDPGSEGTCQHCHARIDPASIHFKRFVFDEGSGGYPILGVGAWQFEGWRDLEYQPWARISRLWDHDMRMTPVTQATLAANPDAAWIDFLPPDQSLLGQVGDGTIGPLGFAKLIVESGAFDRCLVRRLHEAVVGRDINPQRESGYLQSLVTSFVAGGRVVRPLVRELVRGAPFRRGL